MAKREVWVCSCGGHPFLLPGESCGTGIGLGLQGLHAWPCSRRVRIVTPSPACRTASGRARPQPRSRSVRCRPAVLAGQRVAPALDGAGGRRKQRQASLPASLRQPAVRSRGQLASSVHAQSGVPSHRPRQSSPQRSFDTWHRTACAALPGSALWPCRRVARLLNTALFTFEDGLDQQLREVLGSLYPRDLLPRLAAGADAAIQASMGGGRQAGRPLPRSSRRVAAEGRIFGVQRCGPRLPARPFPPWRSARCGALPRPSLTGGTVLLLACLRAAGPVHRLPL